jgi:membrane protein YdbS with pleckstrin-like domain
MFIFYFGIASLLWTPAIVSLAMVLGNELIYYFSVYQDYALWVLMGTILFVLFVLKVIIPLFTFKGRRLLLWQDQSFDTMGILDHICFIYTHRIVLFSTLDKV